MHCAVRTRSPCDLRPTHAAIPGARTRPPTFVASRGATCPLRHFSAMIALGRHRGLRANRRDKPVRCRYSKVGANSPRRPSRSPARKCRGYRQNGEATGWNRVVGAGGSFAAAGLRRGLARCRFARGPCKPSLRRPVRPWPQAITLWQAIGFPDCRERWTNDGEVYLLLGESELERGRNEPSDRRTEAQAAAAAALAAWAKVPAGKPVFRPCLLASRDPPDQHGAVHAGRRNLDDGAWRPGCRGSLRARACAQPALPFPGPVRRGPGDRTRFLVVTRRRRRAISRNCGRSTTRRCRSRRGSGRSTRPTATTTASGSGEPTWPSRPAVSTKPHPWLDRCVSRRPDDPAVWQARLDLAVATLDEAGFWSALRAPAGGRVRRGRPFSSCAPG